MGKNFRSEVFKLCKMIQREHRGEEIVNLIRNLSIAESDSESEEERSNMHGNFAYIAKQYRNQFYGFLFTDENADNLGLPEPLSVVHLGKEERALIERGHSTLTEFVGLCLSELKHSSETLAMLLDPYCLYRKINIDDTAVPLLSDLEMRDAASSFQNGKVYKVLKESNVERLLRKIGSEKLYSSLALVEKEIVACQAGEMSEDTQSFVLKLQSQKFKEAADALFQLFVLISALKQSLSSACQLLYEAMCGDDLIILNNDNIINIKESSDFVCKRYKILIQGADFKHSCSGIGSMILTDCDPYEGRHIHAFGRNTAQTVSFDQEMGITTKYSISEVNEELIDCFHLTDLIVNNGVTKIRYY